MTILRRNLCFRGLAQTPALWGLRFREAKLLEAMPEAPSRFAAANLADIILRMSAPARLAEGRAVAGVERQMSLKDAPEKKCQFPVLKQVAHL